MENTALHRYFDAKKTALAAAVSVDPALGCFVEALNTLNLEEIQHGFAEETPSSRRSFMHDPVLKRAIDAIPAGSALGEAFSGAVPHFDWSILFDGPQAPELLRDTMHVATLAGKSQTAAARGMHAGVFVLHPDLYYPLHSHEADEVYYCISGQVEIQHGVNGRPFTISSGEYSVTPSDCVHALRTATEPVVLAYVWSGDISAPNWWWRQDLDGAWLRERWQWEENREWRSYGAEAVSAEILQRASL